MLSIIYSDKDWVQNNNIAADFQMLDYFLDLSRLKDVDVQQFRQYWCKEPIVILDMFAD